MEILTVDYRVGRLVATIFDRTVRPQAWIDAIPKFCDKDEVVEINR
ncbi:hypothetical protein [Brevibacterium aurantiacum]|nr:hypothetical protein [Brevibacterium aurantiacum]